MLGWRGKIGWWNKRFPIALSFFLLFFVSEFVLIDYYSAITHIPRLFMTPYLAFGNNVMELVTSPFSILEDLSKNMLVMLENIASNLLYPTALIGISEFYYRFNKKRQAARMVWGFGVLSSYATSAVWWIVFGVPSTGTSIISIAFSLNLLYILYMVVNDRRKYRALWNESRKFRVGLAVFALFTLLIVLPTLVSDFVVSINPVQLFGSFQVHATGVVLFLSFLYADKRSKDSGKKNGIKIL